MTRISPKFDIAFKKIFGAKLCGLNKFTQDSNEKLTDIIAKIKNSLDMWIAFLTRNDHN
jgi:hypothetical protein